MVLWPKWGAYELVAVRKIICVYLCSVPLNMIMGTVVEVSPFGLELEISTSLLVLIPLALGRILVSIGCIQGDRCAASAAMMRGWVSAYCCLIVHGFVLLILLNTCYGYGFERSPVVLGWLGLFYLATWALWGTLGEAPWRRCIAVVLVAFYGVLATGQGR